MAPPWTRHALPAQVALPIGFAALLVIGGVAAGTRDQIPALGILVAVAVVVAGICLAAEPLVAPALGLIGWLTVVGFSRPPYAQLRSVGLVAVRAAIRLP